MAKPDEIQSTEKLLDLIRRPTQGPTADDTPTAGTRPAAAPKTASRIRAVRLKKKMVVGVDIGHTYIRLSKAVRLGDKRHELLDYLHIPLGAQNALHDPHFLEQLKNGLDRICGDDAQCDIWSAITSAQVEVRYLRVPKLKKKQVDNAIFWTFTNKVAFNEQDEILDYEILGDLTEDGVRKTEVMAFKAPKSEVEALKAAFEQIGYPLKGISIVPFAIQNLFRTRILPHEEEDVCCLFVGRDWSRIAIYSRCNLVLSRGIKAGMRSMVEAIQMAMVQKDDGTAAGITGDDRGPDASEPRDTVPEGTISPAAQTCFFDFLQCTRPVGSTDQANSSRDPMAVFQMLQPAMERLIRQVERTFEHYAMHFQGNKVKRILLSGQITANSMLVGHIARQLDLPTEVMNPFATEDAFTSAVVTPENQADRESYLPAIGLAISHNTITPNFLHTHKDKETEEGLRRFNQRILIGCMVCLLALLLVFSWQERQLDEKRDTIARLNNQLMEYMPAAEKEIMLALYAQSQKRQQSVGRLVRRYLPVATMQELAQLTPANVRLIGIEADFKPSANPRTPKPRTLALDGIIFGDPGGFETILTSYLLTLRNSPVFARPTVQNRRVEYYDGQEVLRFQANVEIP